MLKLKAIIMVFPSHKVSINNLKRRIIIILIHYFNVHKIRACILSWPMLLSSESVLHIRMCGVVLKLPHWQSLGTNSGIDTGSCGSDKQFVPYAEPIASSAAIPNNVIQGMSHPNATGLHIGLNQRPDLSCIDNQIVLYKVVSFSAILDKNSMSADVVTDGISNSKEMDSMDSCDSCKTFVDSIAICIT